METVEVECPKSINLKNILKDTKSDTRFILQTIDVFDKVIVSSDISKQKGIFIKSKNELDCNLQNDIKKTIDLFFKYTNINVDNLVVELKENEFKVFENYYNIISGLLIGLNVYFNNRLSVHELVYLAKMIDNLVVYYLYCGFKKIDINNKCYNIGNNKYKRYFILQGNDENIYSKITDFVSRYDVDSEYDNNYYFIAIKNNYSLSVPISIKKEFKNIKIFGVENTNKNKILKKYSNYLD